MKKKNSRLQRDILAAQVIEDTTLGFISDKLINI